MPDPNEVSANAAMMREQSAALREAAHILAKANAQIGVVDDDVLLRLMSAAVTDALAVLQAVRS